MQDQSNVNNINVIIKISPKSVGIPTLLLCTLLASYYDSIFIEVNELEGESPAIFLFVESLNK